MRGLVYNNGILAGTLKREADSFVFEYDEDYLRNTANPSISISLPRSMREHRSPVLFPFFYGLLAEGVEKEQQCRVLRIDESDHFRRLLMTAANDTVGAITVRGIE